MEDLDFAISKSGTPFLYKSILDSEIIQKLTAFATEQVKSEFSGQLAPRWKIDLDPSFLPEIHQALITTLFNYFPDLEIGESRIYIQQFGKIKPHCDVSFDGHSNLTCLIYLTEIDSGELILKVKRPEAELTVEPHKKFFHFKITPKVGYGIIFRKELIHWAEEVFCNKIILLVDLFF